MSFGIPLNPDLDPRSSQEKHDDDDHHLNGTHMHFLLLRLRKKLSKIHEFSFYKLKPNLKLKHSSVRKARCDKLE